MPNRPSKSVYSEMLGEERKQQAIWRHVAAVCVSKYGPISVEATPLRAVLDIQETEGGLIVGVEGLRRSLKTRLIGAWRALTG